MKKKYVCHDCGKDAGHSHGYGSDGNKVWCHGCGQDIANTSEVKLDDDNALIVLDLPDEVILQLSLEAHSKDITLNELINNLLKEMLEKEGLIN